MKTRIRLIATQGLIFLLLYFACGFIASSQGASTPWRTIWLDDLIPFVPAFIWAYAFAYPLATVGLSLAVWHIEDEDFRMVLSACYLNIVILAIFYLAMPRVAIRPTLDTLTASGMAMLLSEQIMFACNTFPSGHVSYAVITAWAAKMSYRKNRLLSTSLIALAILVTTSTMLTKKHTVLDVVGGACTAAVCIALARLK